MIVGMALVFLLCQCESPKPEYGRKPPSNFDRAVGQLARGSVTDSLATPPHSFSPEDYPFDAQGNYREDWVRGEGMTARTAVQQSGAGGMDLRYHVVKPEDTLYSLSRQYGVTLYDLRHENGLSDYQIRVGQVLMVPAQS